MSKQQEESELLKMSRRLGQTVTKISFRNLVGRISSELEDTFECEIVSIRSCNEMERQVWGMSEDGVTGEIAE